MRYWSIFTKLLKTKILSTVVFNFRYLPFKQALHLPVWLYPGVIIKVQGGVKIDCAASPGMIKIGKNDYYPTTIKPVCNWNISGTVVFSGKINFLQSSEVYVAPNAVLSFGSGGAFCGSNFRCYCYNRIDLGNTQITWECSLDDNNEVIRIGNGVWVGNRTTILGRTIIADNVIVAQCSTVHGDYAQCGDNIILAGNPAEVKSDNVACIWDTLEEKQLDSRFGYSRTHL